MSAKQNKDDIAPKQAADTPEKDPKVRAYNQTFLRCGIHVEKKPITKMDKFYTIGLITSVGLLCPPIGIATIGLYIFAKAGNTIAGLFKKEGQAVSAQKVETPEAPHHKNSAAQKTKPSVPYRKANVGFTTKYIR